MAIIVSTETLQKQKSLRNLPIASVGRSTRNASEWFRNSVPWFISASPSSARWTEDGCRSYCFLTPRVVSVWRQSCARALPRAAEGLGLCLVFQHAQPSLPPGTPKLAFKHFGIRPSLCISYWSSVSIEMCCKHLQIHNRIYNKLEKQTVDQSDAEFPIKWERYHCQKLKNGKCFSSKKPRQNLFLMSDAWSVLSFSPWSHDMFWSLSPRPKPFLHLQFPCCWCPNKMVFWSTSSPKVLQKTFLILKEQHEK